MDDSNKILEINTEIDFFINNIQDYRMKMNEANSILFLSTLSVLSVDNQYLQILALIIIFFFFFLNFKKANSINKPFSQKKVLIRNIIYNLSISKVKKKELENYLNVEYNKKQNNQQVLKDGGYIFLSVFTFYLLSTLFILNNIVG